MREQMASQLAACTFTPILNKRKNKSPDVSQSAISPQYLNEKKHRCDVDKTTTEEKIHQEELKQCSFTPKINRDRSPLNKSRVKETKEVAGYSQQVQRMKQANLEREQKKQAYEDLGKVRINAARSKSPAGTTITKPFSFSSNYEPRKIF